MGKSIPAPNPHGIGKKKKDPKAKFSKILEKYGIPSARLGGYEYMVATNLMIFEQLKKMRDQNFSMLDF
jgi:hypothetical protein